MLALLTTLKLTLRCDARVLCVVSWLCFYDYGLVYIALFPCLSHNHYSTPYMGEPRNKARSIFSTIERKQVERRIKLLTKWFEQLRESTLQQLKENRVTVSDLCNKVSSLNALAIDESIEKFLEKKMRLLSDSDTHELVFLYLNMYWSYLYYHLLEKLIRDYEMDDLEKRMEEFKAEVIEFMEQTPVKVYAAAQITQHVEPPDGFVKFVSHHKYSKDSLLKCVEDIRRKFGTQYKFEEYDVEHRFTSEYRNSLVYSRVSCSTCYSSDIYY